MAAEAKASDPRVIHVPDTAEADRMPTGSNPARVWLSGSLKKKGRHSWSGWNEYWFVLYRGHKELRYYQTVTRAKWGGTSINIPIEEHGVFPLDSIQDVRDVEKGKYGGTRFDLVIRTMGRSHYPGEFTEHDERPWFQYTERILQLMAPDASSKELWVDTLRAMKQGAGKLGAIEKMLRQRGSAETSSFIANEVVDDEPGDEELRHTAASRGRRRAR